jgi:hypothetical protein
MMNNTSSNANENRCEYCGTDKTYIAVTKNGTPYPCTVFILLFYGLYSSRLEVENVSKRVGDSAIVASHLAVFETWWIRSQHGSNL